MSRKYEVSKLEFNKNIEGDLESTINQGIKIMDALQSVDIVEATFSNGNYFKADESNRAIVSEKIMLTETDTDLVVRFPKDGHTIEEIIKTNVPEPTQKMLASYVGKSQSTVSRKK